MFIAPADGPLPYAPISVIDISGHHSHRRTVSDGRPSQVRVIGSGRVMVRRVVGSTRESFIATRVALLLPIVKHFRA